MTDEPGLKYGRWATLLIGIATFVVGLALLVSVFNTAKAVLASIDQQIARVQTAPPVNSPAGENQTAAPAQDSHGKTVAARPAGPSIASIAAVLGLKLFGLLVLGWLAAMIAARGASLAAGALCPRQT